MPATPRTEGTGMEQVFPQNLQEKLILLTPGFHTSGLQNCYENIFLLLQDIKFMVKATAVLGNENSQLDGQYLPCLQTDKETQRKKQTAFERLSSKTL